MALPSAEAAAPGPLTDPQDLYWLIRIRWVMIVVLLVGAVGTRIAGTITLEGFEQGLLLFAGIALYNLLFLWALRAGGTAPRSWRRSAVRWLQQPCDILSITLLLHIIPTGGVTPLTIFYAAAILAAVVILPPRGIYVIAAFALVCYAGLVRYEFYLRPLTPPYTLLYYLRTSLDAARIPLNAIVMTAIAVGSMAFIAAHFARRLRANTAQIRRQLADLTTLHDELRERALRDSLTNLFNHGALIERLETAICEAAANGSPVGLIMLDLDHFKMFNDRWGHQAGDVALRAVAAAVQRTVPPGAIVGRWGGEEFTVVLPGAAHAEAAAVAAQIRAVLAAAPFPDAADHHWSSPTASQGVAVYPQDAASPDALVAAADRALYMAKAQGRNRIISGPPPRSVGERIVLTAEDGVSVARR